MHTLNKIKPSKTFSHPLYPLRHSDIFNFSASQWCRWKNLKKKKKLWLTNQHNSAQSRSLVISLFIYFITLRRASQTASRDKHMLSGPACQPRSPLAVSAESLLDFSSLSSPHKKLFGEEKVLHSQKSHKTIWKSGRPSHFMVLCLNMQAYHVAADLKITAMYQYGLFSFLPAPWMGFAPGVDVDYLTIKLPSCRSGRESHACDPLQLLLSLLV